jgi:hypothetical protein
MSDSYADKLWLVANVVTGFAAVQGLSLMYAWGDPKYDRHTTRRPVQWTALGLVTASAVLYCVAVWRCDRLASALPDYNPSIWAECTWGRVAGILFFLAATLTTIIYRMCDKGAPDNRPPPGTGKESSP